MLPRIGLSPIWEGDTTAPRLNPDASRHRFTIDYVPNADGAGTLTVSVDGQASTLQVTAGQRADEAILTRFGICQFANSGNGPAQTIYYDAFRVHRELTNPTRWQARHEETGAMCLCIRRGGATTRTAWSAGTRRGSPPSSPGGRAALGRGMSTRCRAPRRRGPW